MRSFLRFPRQRSFEGSWWWERGLHNVTTPPMHRFHFQNSREALDLSDHHTCYWVLGFSDNKREIFILFPVLEALKAILGLSSWTLLAQNCDAGFSPAQLEHVLKFFHSLPYLYSGRVLPTKLYKAPHKALLDHSILICIIGVLDQLEIHVAQSKIEHYKDV